MRIFILAVILSASPLTFAEEQVGRYQIIHSPHARADTFLLDTVTGRTWQHVVDKSREGELTLWNEDERVDWLRENGGIMSYGEFSRLAPLKDDTESSDIGHQEE